LKRYVASAVVAAEQVGEELLLVHLKTGKTYRVNRTGRLIWELACASCSAGEIVERLQAGFPITPATLEADVTSLLNDLVENGLLELRPEEAS
jgi:hypothetical protein